MKQHYRGIDENIGLHESSRRTMLHWRDRWYSFYGLSCIVADSVIDMRKIANIDQQWAAASGAVLKARSNKQSASIDDLQLSTQSLITTPVANFTSYSRRLCRLHL